MIVNQWVPAAHRGDAIGDQRPARARPAARAGPRVRHLRADDRRRHARRGAAVRRSGGAAGDVTIFHFALPSPMTAGVRHAAGRARAPVPQHHAGALLRRLRRRTSSGSPSIGRHELATLVGPRGPRARRLGVQPRRNSTRSASRPPASCPSPSTSTASPRRRARRRSSRCSDDGLINFLFVGRIAPNKKIEDHIRLAEHYKRYVDSPLPVHLRRAARRRAALLRHAARPDGGVPDAGRPVLVHRTPCRTRSWPPTTGTRASTSR